MCCFRLVQIPIQRLKPARPAPAPAVNKGSASGTQSKKRRFNAVAKGTTTTLAALCCLFLFYSPTLPGFQAPGGFHADSPHSTALQLADVKPLTGRGRVLQAVPGNGESSDDRILLELLTAFVSM